MIFLHICNKKRNYAKMNPEAIAEKLRNEFAKQGITPCVISSKTGVSVSQISRFTQGKFKRKSKGLLKICNELNISLIKCPKKDRDLELAVIHAWDGTSEHKQNIIKILNLISTWG